MGRDFNVPNFYRSDLISKIKQEKKVSDPKRRDLSPSILKFPNITFKIARHFGFCFGVENAIDIAYKTVEENPDKNVFLLSEMIHNPNVNDDLKNRGVRFLMDTKGNIQIPFEELSESDIVVIPAFGTTLSIHKKLLNTKIKTILVDTTCPFVEKVWKRGEDLGKKGYSIIVHGKWDHEETKATFSHCSSTAPTLVIYDTYDAKFLAEIIQGCKTYDDFYQRFKGKYSEDFLLPNSLDKVGVVNQTTMLASETKEVMHIIKSAIQKKHNNLDVSEYFAETRDTLCYATNENQSAAIELFKSKADLSIIVGGYNSSNTSHLVELSQDVMPTFYIKDENEILSKNEISHYDLLTKSVIKSTSWLPHKTDLTIALTAGASCPDIVIEKVVKKLSSLVSTEQNKVTTNENI